MPTLAVPLGLQQPQQKIKVNQLMTPTADPTPPLPPTLTECDVLYAVLDWEDPRLPPPEVAPAPATTKLVVDRDARLSAEAPAAASS